MINQAACAKFAVNRKIEQCKVSNALAELKVNADGPDVVQLNGGF